MLKNLYAKTCPICGETEVVKEEVEWDKNRYTGKREIRKHTSGQQFESRTFLCGYKVEHHAGRDSKARFNECVNDETIIKKKQEELKQLEEILATVEGVIKSPVVVDIIQDLERKIGYAKDGLI